MATRVNSKSIQELELIGGRNRGLDVCAKHEDRLCEVIARKVDQLFDLSRFQDHLDELDHPGEAHFNIQLTQREILVELVNGEGYLIGNVESFRLTLSAREILREADRLYRKCQTEKHRSSGRDRFASSLDRRHMSPLPRSTRLRKDLYRRADSFETRARDTRSRSAERDRRLPSSHLSPAPSPKLESKGPGSSSAEPRRFATNAGKREKGESPSFSSPAQSPTNTDSPASDASRSPERTVRELSFNLHGLQDRLSTLRSSPKPTRKEIRQLRGEIAKLKGLIENPYPVPFGGADFGSFPQTTASTYTDGRHFSTPRNADFRPSFSMGTEAPATHLNNENAQLKARIEELKITSENAQLKAQLKELERQEEERLQPKMKEEEAKALIEEQRKFKLEAPFQDNDSAPLELPPQPEEKKRWWDHETLSPTLREQFRPKWEDWERQRELRIQILRTKIETEKEEKEQEEKNKKMDEKRRRDEANRVKDEKLRGRRQTWQAHLRSVEEHKRNPVETIESKGEKRKTSLQQARDDENLNFEGAIQQRDEKETARTKRAKQKLENIKQKWQSLPKVTQGHYIHRSNQRGENSRPTLSSALPKFPAADSPFLTFRDPPSFRLTDSPLVLGDVDRFEV